MRVAAAEFQRERLHHRQVAKQRHEQLGVALPSPACCRSRARWLNVLIGMSMIEWLSRIVSGWNSNSFLR